jgi:predicted O-methyltransferase YrrM
VARSAATDLEDVTLTRIVRQRLVLLGAGAVVLLGMSMAVAALLEQWPWVVVLLSASVIALAVIGVGIFLRQGELLRLQRREAEWTRRVEERRRRFERGQLPNRIDDSVQRALRLLGDRSDLRTDLLEQTVLASVQVIRDDITRSQEGSGAVEQSLSRVVRQQLGTHEQMVITELDALHQLHRRFPIDGSLPLLGGWALKPTGLLQLLDLAVAESVRTVVECGSGVSTVYLAWLLRHEPAVKLVALEHQTDFADAIRGRLRDLELDHVAEVRLAPLEPMSFGDWRGEWYALDAVHDLDAIDLLLVDGPPKSTGEQARYPALPVFESRMSPRGIILLDDANRSEERAVLEAWLDGGRWRTGRSSTTRQAVLHQTDAV